MDLPVKRLIFGLCIFVGIWSCQIVEVNSSGCHYFSKDQLDWFDALYFCQRLKMCLADMSTRVSFEELENKQTERAEFWIGLNVYEKLDFSYVSNNKIKQYVPPQSELSLDKACAYIKPLASGSYAIGTSSCGRVKRFVCTPTIRCNGIATNSSTVFSQAHNIPCKMSAEVTNIIALQKP
ncbi:uncharacterized protein LOC117890173 [Drosophila subobscura]|uniref:uncharacterized protein LOC117890173 n=1 Tax=Drosophila subobscura TaxID=7241 RepID=UPI00155AE570|nr:uncharacterized protein LOC117890173 [Drosophila subobscura]